MRTRHLHDFHGMKISRFWPKTQYIVNRMLIKCIGYRKRIMQCSIWFANLHTKTTLIKEKFSIDKGISQVITISTLTHRLFIFNGIFFQFRNGCNLKKHWTKNNFSFLEIYRNFMNLLCSRIGLEWRINLQGRRQFHASKAGRFGILSTEFICLFLSGITLKSSLTL